MLSGLNLAYFTISKLGLELEASKGNRYASRILKLRHDSNFLLALLSGSVVSGVMVVFSRPSLLQLSGKSSPMRFFTKRAPGWVFFNAGDPVLFVSTVSGSQANGINSRQVVGIRSNPEL